MITANKLDLNDQYNSYLVETFQELSHHRHGDDFGTPTLSVSFKVDAKLWKSLRDKHGLGSLYGTDLSNLLSRLGALNEYCVPIVSDRQNAKQGLKYISIEYRLKGHPYR